MCDSNRPQFSGYVVGICHDETRNYLMYSSGFGDFLKIDRDIEVVSPGRWLDLTVKTRNFDSRQVLNTENCDGFYNFDNVIPPRMYVHARYFPLKYNMAFGEVVFSVKMTVVVDHRTKSFNLECYEINPKHIAPSELMSKIQIRHGKKYIFELQASLAGWVLLKIHDDQPYCDELEDPFVPYDVSFLDQTELPSLLTKYQINYREKLTKSWRGEEEKVVRRPTSLDSPSTSTSTPSGESSPQDRKASPSPEPRHPVRARDSSPSPEPLRPTKAKVPSLSPEPRRQARKPSPSPEPVRERSLEQIRQVRTTSPPCSRNSYSKLDDTFGGCDAVEMRYIEGTKGLRKRGESGRNENRKWLREAGLNNLEDIKAIGVVIYRTEKYAIIFVREPHMTKNPTVTNALLIFDDCKGSNKSLKVGEFAAFRLSKRRQRSDDWASIHIPFSHICTEQLSTSGEKASTQISLFRNLITSFCGILQVKVEADLKKIHTLTPYYDGTEMKSVCGRRFYIVRTCDGFCVTIPCQRLQSYLDSKFCAPFVIQTWALLKKPIGNFCLHIGTTTEVLCIKEDGNTFMLPPLSDGFISNEFKRGYCHMSNNV